MRCQTPGPCHAGTAPRDRSRSCCPSLLLAACGEDDAGDAAADDVPPAVAEAIEAGKQLSLTAGCTACHGVDGRGGIGPAWAGSLGETVELADDSTATIDEAYITRAIEDPAAQVHTGFSVAMPEVELSDDQIADLVAYILSLNGATSAEGG